jgi:hypothetical protein
MIQYIVQCHCGRQELHGFERPRIDVQTCLTARAIRAGCKDWGCRFEVVERQAELDDVDRLRLGLRDDVAIGVEHD